MAYRGDPSWPPNPTACKRGIQFRMGGGALEHGKALRRVFQESQAEIEPSRVLYSLS